MDLDLRQQLLELDSVREKLEKVTGFLTRELEVLELGKKIQSQAQEEMGKAQREYFLREQMKAIQKELGEESEEAATVNELREKIEQAHDRGGAVRRPSANSRASRSCPPPRPNTRSSAPTSNPRCLAAVEQEHRQADRRVACAARCSTKTTTTWRRSRRASSNTSRCAV